MDMLRDSTNPHIIKLLASYKQDNIQYFLFPLANCHLDEFMREFEPEKSNRFLIWVLSQIRGIANALKEVHTYITIDIPATEPLSKSDGSLLPFPANGRRRSDILTGYHHDLKPQNILHFSRLRDGISTPNPEWGIFVIADFGVGKFHTLKQATHIISEGTTHARGTATYAAPESKIKAKGLDNLKVSRPYDVWSLGCIIMEILVWLVLGKSEWEKFNSQRVGAIDEDGMEETDGYFFIRGTGMGKKAEVRQCVKDMMSSLRRNERLNDGTKCLVMMVRLVGQVLDVDPQARISAEDLVKALDDIISQAKADPDPYLHPTGALDAICEHFPLTHNTPPVVVPDSPGYEIVAVTPQSGPPRAPLMPERPAWSVRHTMTGLSNQSLQVVVMEENDSN